MTLNANEIATFGDLTNVSAEKLQDLENILTAILALPMARDIYAQIIDGTPLRTPFSDEFKAGESLYIQRSIIVGDKIKPSDHALQEYEKIRADFAPQKLKLDLKLAQAYQNTPPDSPEYLLRLLEMVAASVHTLAGLVYASYHRDLDIKPPMPPGGYHLQFHQTDHFYVDFYHTSYQRFNDYPSGLLNVVGYWAEAELFGGVVLFEREDSGLEVINAFLHPQRMSHAFQLSITQLESFANLGRAGHAAKSLDAETVLPFSKEVDARIELTFGRVGEAPIRIYKNEYDKPPVSRRARRCVIGEGDPRAESWQKTMETVKAKGWIKRPLEEDDAASTSKGDPHDKNS